MDVEHTLEEKSKIRSDLNKASDVLNEDHFGLEEVKERILEYLAVQKRVKKLKGPVLCLVGLLELERLLWESQ